MTGPGGGRGRGGKPGRGGGSGRGVAERVKTARRRTPSSARWLARQLCDRYVAEARKHGYRSRAAFKLAQIDDKVHVLKRGARVVDLGAAPGGWIQVALERCGRTGRVVGIDLGEVEPLPGAVLLVGDVRDEAARERVKAALGGPADVVLSDMAAPATGHAGTDHLRVMALLEAAIDFAEDALAPGGAFIAKVLIGGTEGALLARLKRGFAKVRHVKPPASRAESAEMYVVATGFRGPSLPAEGRAGD
ncbi:MAG: RlmE family RNA methyltransferase [Kiloniellaceae bacterium]